MFLSPARLTGWLAIAGLTVLVALPAGGCAGDGNGTASLPPDVAATIGSATIRTADVNRTAAAAPARTRKEGLRSLIHAEWIARELRARTLPPAAGRTAKGGYDALLRDQIRSQPGPSDADIEAYYSAHQPRFFAPEQRYLRLVQLKTKAERRSSQARLHRLFFRLLTDQAPATADAGDAFTIVEGKLKPPLDEEPLDAAVFDTAPGVITGPVRTASGWYLFEVMGTPDVSRRKPLGAVRGTIVRALEAERGKAAARALETDLVRTYRPRTTCAERLAVALCHR